MKTLTRYLSILLIASALLLSSGTLPASTAYAATAVGGQFHIWGGFFHLLGGFFRFFNPVAASGGSGTCPQGTGFGDGCQGAQASGSVQHSNFFTSYVRTNSATAGVFQNYSRPPWNVPGVDYPVGYTGALSDATTATMPSCATRSTDSGGGPTVHKILITSTHCTLDHLDFNASGGTCVHVAGGLSGSVTLTNDKFSFAAENGGGCFLLGSLTIDTGSAVDLLVKYSEFDMPQAIYYPDTTSVTTVNTNSSIYGTITGGTITIEYTAFLQCPSGCTEFIFNGASTTVNVNYNYVEGMGGMGYAKGLHTEFDGIIINTGKTLTQWTDSHNVFYMGTGGCCATAVTTPGQQVLPGGSETAFTHDHNVLVTRPYGTGAQCGVPPTQPGCTYGPAALISNPGNPPTAPLNNYTFTNNYIDQSGTGDYIASPSGYSGLFYTATYPTAYTCSSNVDLNNGAAITGNPLANDGTWVCN